MRRSGGRAPNRLRPVSLTPGYLDFAEGSCLITWGRTRVLCAATVLETVPPFRQARGGGWVTAEYAMLPRASYVRQERESRRGGLQGRLSWLFRLHLLRLRGRRRLRNSHTPGTSSRAGESRHRLAASQRAAPRFPTAGRSR
jgi:ribonuclease PH